jgi:peptide deformylase
MSVHTILKMGNPLLREISEEFSEEDILSKETKKLILDMFETMVDAGGLGLAAPQIGVNKQLTVIELPCENPRYPEVSQSERYIIFNPKITVLNNEKQGFWEGCLSVPGLRGFVERPKDIKISYLDENASPKSIELSGFLATVFQHELDHLFGKIYIDHIKDSKLLIFETEAHFLDKSE